jgi:hypothetical protein
MLFARNGMPAELHVIARGRRRGARLTLFDLVAERKEGNPCKGHITFSPTRSMKGMGLVEYHL